MIENLKVKGSPRILLQEITREWEFEYEGKEYTFREYEGIEGRRMWLDGEEIDDFDEELLNELTAYAIYEICNEY
jgi:hypothetical protein